MIKLLLDKLIFGKNCKRSLYSSNSFTVDEGTLEKAIRKSVDDIDKNPSSLRQNLIKSGLSDFEVTRIIAFLPEACQRVVFKEMSDAFSGEYIFICSNYQTQLKGNLLEDPIFLECFRIIDRGFKFFYNKKRLVRIAEMSATSQVIQMALENGSKIENIYFGPVTVMFDEIPAELLEKP